MSADEPIGTVVVETRDGKPVVLRADPHILVSAKFLIEYEGAQGNALVLPGGTVYVLGEYEGAQGNALVLPGGTVYVLGEYEPGRAVRHAYRTGSLAPEVAS